MGKLNDRVALVTGGQRGLGAAILKEMAAEGATCIVNYPSASEQEEADALVGELGGMGVFAAAMAADISDTEAANSLIAGIQKRFGRLDILVNNAGTAYRKPPQDYTLADWQRVIDVNLTGAFVCAHAAYPHMLQAGGGKIINIGSMLSIFATSYAVAYAASKGGIVQMTKALACAWAKDNIQANAILPGWIDTEFTRTARQEVPGLHERVLARTPAGRWGSPDDLCGVAVFLASPASAFVTGAAIPVDGGFSAQG